MTQIASTQRPTRFAEHSLVAYIAPLVEGRRVAVVGPSSVELARRAREFGAQSVVAFGGSGEGVAVRPLGPGAIEAFRSRIDCVIIPDAEAIPLAKVLDEARRALGRDGMIVVATPAVSKAASNRAVDFHSLRGALEERFGFVKMIGCGSFAGFALASFEDAAQDVTLDTRLMPDEPVAPEIFIAVAADARFDVDAMAIVQVPYTQPAPPVAEGPDPATLDALDRLQRADRALAAALDERASATDRANAASAAADAARTELATARIELRKSTQRAADLARTIEESESSERELRAALEQAERDRDNARRDLQRARTESKDREKSVGDDIARFERSLANKGRECESIRAQLEDRDSAVRELLFQLDAARGSEGSQRMTALEARNAELGALHAALGAEATRVAEQNEILRERITRLEAVIEARDAEARQLEFQLAQARSQSAAVAKAKEDERAAARHAEELQRLRSEYEAKLAAARSEHDSLARRVRAESDAENALAQVEQAARAARAREEADEEAAKLRSELESQRRRAIDAELALNNTLARMTALEAAESDARARAASAETRLADATRSASAPNSAAIAPLHEELTATKARAASLDAALAEERDRLANLAKIEGELRKQLDESLSAEDDLQEQLSNARVELSRQLALNGSIDERVSQLELQLEGSRKGYTRRVRELEREVEQLVRALEVATSSAGEEADAVTGVMRELDAARAERNGIAMRLADAEAALEASAQRVVAHDAAQEQQRSATATALDSDRPAASDHRAEQLLATLAETAARLASTEESLADLTAQLNASNARARELEDELSVARTRVNEARDARPAHIAPTADTDALRREASERELLVRSLVAQLEDRDLRLRALERRLVEEVERARRTESEIWELELRARDQRIAAMQREIERAPSAEPRATSDGALRAELVSKTSEVEGAQRAIERVRTTLSAILVDGRGAGVSHELVALLRELDEPDSASE